MDPQVKTALASTVTKARSDVERSYRKNKIPADYSLGFVNALIFYEHHVNGHVGQPKFYDRTTAIGALPKPVVLRTERFPNIMGADEMCEQHRDAVILAVRNGDQVGARIALKNLDKFMFQMEEIKNVQEDLCRQKKKRPFSSIASVFKNFRMSTKKKSAS